MRKRAHQIQRKLKSPTGRFIAERLEPRFLLAAQMVGDFTPGTPGSNPTQIADLNGTLFFIADDGVHGRELWKSNGTAQGTVMVKDVQPGPVGGLNNSWLVACNGNVFFSADDGSNGNELWKSDGTTDGTVMVKDIVPGPNSSYPGERSGDDSYRRAVVGNTLYFRASDENGGELWKSDGTLNGTVMVTDLNPGPGSSYPIWLTAFNGQLIFGASSDGNNVRLFRTDGTPQGTVQLNPAGQNIVNPSQMTASGNYVYFVDTNTAGTLRRTDGTVTGTSIVNQPGGGVLGSLTDVSGKLYYVGNGGIYAYDPATGASLVASSTPPGPDRPQYLTGFNGKLYFRAEHGAAIPALWTSDGTSAGTKIISDAQPETSNSQTRHFVPYQNGFIFIGSDGNGGRALWKSDGTTAGTIIIKAMDLPTPDYALPINLVVSGNAIFFIGNAPNSGPELFSSDGTTAGTGLLKDVNSAGLSSTPTFGAELNGILYFGGANGSQLWRSDGTLAGTSPASDLFPGGAPNNPTNLINVGGILYFTASPSGSNTKRLWRTHGTPAGTFSLRPAAGGDDPSELVNMNGTLYFAASAGSGRLIWKTDGTLANTASIGSGYTLPFRLTVAGNRVFFISNGTVGGTEVWSTDGTNAGTSMTKDIVPGNNGSNPDSLIALGNTVYFLATGLEGDTFLWESNGTTAGTVPIISLANSYPGNFIAANGLLFFLRTDPDTGRELWETDGTAAGTRIVRDIVPGPGWSLIKNMLVLGNTLYFQANDIVHGGELWKTDGTTAGTQLVADISPGVNGSDAQPAFNANGLLILTAIDPAHGRELWQSDGTAAGTTLIADINPGTDSSNPVGYTMANGVLYFCASDGIHGTELWKLPDIPQVLRAEAGGPYAVPEGQNVSLSSYGSTGNIATYEWDFDYDPAAGFQVDATGRAPQFSGLDGPSIHAIALRVTSTTGDSRIDTSQIQVNNVLPKVNISGPATAVVGAAYIMQLSYSDPGQDTPKSWKIEWGDGLVETIQGAPATASHIYAQTGTHSIYAWVTDDDGTFTAQTTGVTVGGLDKAFASTGILGLPTFGNTNPLVNDVQVRADGRIVILGFDWTIWQYMPDGSPDLSFGGGDGVIRPGIDAPSRTQSSATAMAIQSDGKFLVVGASPSGAVLARFNSDGTVDSTFHTSTSSAGASDIALQSDGKILLTGTQNNNLWAARFNSDGLNDTAFGINGSATAIFNATTSGGISVAQLAGGNILVGGHWGSRLVLARFTAQGILDLTFGPNNDGMVATPFTSIDATAYAFTSDSKIVGVGHTTTSSNKGYLDVVRFNPDGTPDTTFNGTGQVTTIAGTDSGATSVFVDPSGRILVGGRSNFTFTLFRYLPSGQPDPDFGNGGQFVDSTGTIGGYVTRLAFTPSGKIIAAASSGNTGGTDFVIQLAQSPLSVQVAEAGPVGAAEVLIPSHSSGGSITPSDSLLKLYEKRSLFSDRRIVSNPRPILKAPSRRLDVNRRT